MKASERLSQQLGANINESMGAGRGSDGAGGFLAAPVHGGPDKYRGAARVKDALAIELDRIVPDPDQPRKEFDPGALDDLAASLKARGQLQPIRVRWGESEQKWVIIAGERRYRAAAMAGLPTLLCVEVKGTPSAEDILEDQLVENCLREDLKPVEQARAFQALIDRRGLSYRQLAETLSIGHQAIVRALGLLDLPEDLQRRVDAGAIPASAAYEASRLEDDSARREILGKVESGELTRDDVARVVRESAAKGGPKSKGRGAGKGPGKGRKVTSRTIRTAAGRVTVENGRGLDDTLVIAALRAALQQAEASAEGRGEAA
jgi:ParB family chromosome partitioning protein